MVAGSAPGGRRGPRRQGPALDGDRPADGHHGDLAGAGARRRAAALLSAYRALRRRGLATGQDEPREADASASGGRKTDGLRGEIHAGGVPPGGRRTRDLISGQTLEREGTFVAQGADSSRVTQRKRWELATVADKTAQTIYIDADPRTVMD